MTPLSRTALAVAIGAAMVLAPSQAALAADHTAELDSGYATITLDLGAEAANATASLLILDSGANVDSPRQSEIVYLNELTMGPDGTLLFRVLLDGGRLEDYVIASNFGGGTRYVAPLAEVAGGGGTTGPGGSTGGGTGDGSTGGGAGDGSTGGGAGGGSGPDGTGSGSTGSGTRPTGSVLPWTGMAEWMLPTFVGVGIAAILAGGALLVLRRRLGKSAEAAPALPGAEELADPLA